MHRNMKKNKICLRADPCGKLLFAAALCSQEKAIKERNEKGKGEGGNEKEGGREWFSMRPTQSQRE